MLKRESCRTDQAQMLVDILSLLAAIGVWILLQYVILPKMGVPT